MYSAVLAFSKIKNGFVDSKFLTLPDSMCVFYGNIRLTRIIHQPLSVSSRFGTLRENRTLTRGG